MHVKINALVNTMARSGLLLEGRAALDLYLADQLQEEETKRLSAEKQITGVVEESKTEQSVLMATAMVKE